MANIQAKITFRAMPDGAREITHPSGVKVIETRAQRQLQRAEMVRMTDDLMRQIVDFDIQEEKIIATIVIADEDKSEWLTKSN